MRVQDMFPGIFDDDDDDEIKPQMTEEEKQELLDLMEAENERLAKINSKPSQ